MDNYIGCMIKRINGRILLHQSELMEKIKLQFEPEIKDILDYMTPGAPGTGRIGIKGDDISIREKSNLSTDLQ